MIGLTTARRHRMKGCGCEAKRATARLASTAWPHVMLKGLRVTLAVRFVLPDEGTLTVLDDLLTRLEKLKIRLARLFLDKGFAGIAVLDELTRRGQPALIACPIRGRTGGTRALCQRAI